MEKNFIVETVNAAVNLIKEEGKVAFNKFRTKSGDFYFYDTYVFVINEKGHDYVNPAFPNLEGRNVYDLRDEEGKYFIREFIQAVKTKGSGWVDYIWARPGETTLVKKTAFVKGLTFNGDFLVVGSGVYIE
jgi:signal transduction histidine kinase